MTRHRRSWQLCAAVLPLVIGLAEATHTAVPPTGQLITTVPSTLFNNTLPPERFTEICDRAVTTARATGLSDEQRHNRIVAEGGSSDVIYRDADLLVYLTTPPVDVYIGCYAEAEWVDRLKSPERFSPPPTGDVRLYVLNPGRKRPDYPLTKARMLFLDTSGAVVKEVKPSASGDDGVPIKSGDTVVAWPSAFAAIFSYAFRDNDNLVPDFAKAATLRLEFTQDDVLHVLDFAVIRP